MNIKIYRWNLSNDSKKIILEIVGDVLSIKVDEKLQIKIIQDKNGKYFSIITFKKRKIVLPDLYEKISKNHPVINNYKFYISISSDNPFMTLLLNFTNPEINYEYESFLHFISPLYEQTLINIQIIFIYNNLSSDFIKKPSMESIIKDK